MLVQPSKQPGQIQRIQVETERDGADRRVRIRVENHDEVLGWYPSGSLTLALHQLPLLEQAIEEMRAGNFAEETGADKIIPFPGRAPGSNH